VPRRVRGLDWQDPPDGLTTSCDNSVQQQVQQPERLPPIVRNRYSPHQQLKRP